MRDESRVGVVVPVPAVVVAVVVMNMPTSSAAMLPAAARCLPSFSLSRRAFSRVSAEEITGCGCDCGCSWGCGCVGEGIWSFVMGGMGIGVACERVKECGNVEVVEAEIDEERELVRECVGIEGFC